MFWLDISFAYNGEKGDICNHLLQLKHHVIILTINDKYLYQEDSQNGNTLASDLRNGIFYLTLHLSAKDSSSTIKHKYKFPM